MLSAAMHGGLGWVAFGAFWGLLALLALAELWRPLHVGVDEPAGRIAGNIGLGLVNAGLGLALPLSTVLPAAWAHRHGVGLMNSEPLPYAIALAATLLLRNLATWMVHRASHAAPLLWRVHRVHHADVRLDLSTGFRNHPLELAYVAPWLAAFTIAFGLDPATLAAYEATAIGFSLWTHANVRLPVSADRWLRLLFVTPAMHHVHHSSRRTETDSNYGDVFSFWDRLFGTYRPLGESEVKAVRFGLGDAFDREAPSFVRQLAGPFEAPERRGS
ncbi:MAG TPA: sterol desaturase family protein [Allosphingosinicella sp.]|jgi:sterol desaturase/sphingolipid hydroxylase (fatty acid hydroxylase superfamily)